MSEWKKLAQWMYGDVKTSRGFWYSHPLHEIRGLNEDQLLWVPDVNCLCMLWHVGHIAHRERVHIGKFLQGHEGPVIPGQYEVFGTNWCSVDRVRESIQPLAKARTAPGSKRQNAEAILSEKDFASGSIDSVQGVLDWITDVRGKSTEFIESLGEDDFHKVPPTSESGLTIGHWLFITVSHGAIHLGRIQMLRAMLEEKHDRPC